MTAPTDPVRPSTAGPDEPDPRSEREPSGPASSSSESSSSEHPGRIARARAQVDRTRQLATERAAELEERVPPVGLAGRFWRRYRDVNGVVLAGHLAFRSFTFILPLALVLISIAGFLDASGVDPGDTTENLGLGQALAASLRSAGHDAGEAPYHVAFVALLGIILGSLGMLSGFHYVYARAWLVDERKIEARWTKLWRFVLAFAFLFVILIAAAALKKSNFVFGVAATLAVGAVIGLAFVGLALIMPRRATSMVDLVPGGIVGAIGVVALQAFATLWLPGKLDSYSATYGALGVGVVFISYLFLVGQIVVASAIANAVWFDWRYGDVDHGGGAAGAPGAAGASEPRGDDEGEPV